MIKATDLRIGNWVLRYGEPYDVTSTTLYLIQKCELEVEPIQLTPEILEKAGFKMDSHCDGCYLTYHLAEDGTDTYSDIEIYFSFRNWKVEPSVIIMQKRDGDRPEIRPHAEFKYLHQLQNFFYCLFGEELTISL